LFAATLAQILSDTKFVITPKMAFITKTDYESSIHAEILDAVTRQDDSILDIIANQAMEEVASYLAGRYDTAAIFAEEDTGRHPLILSITKDVVLYHLHAIHNPARFPQIRQDRYDRAIDWLKGVQRGDINPVGLPLKEHTDGTEGAENTFQISSNTKRQNHY
jgi:phage gp36-like protein